MKADQKHRCDDRCVCPIHGTPLIYWPSGDDHACQDSDCQYGHGVNANLPDLVPPWRKQATSKPLVTCQCARWPDEKACGRVATAEDFLCDPCRQAAHGVPDKCLRAGINGVTFTAHVEVLPWSERPAVLR